MSSTGRGSGDHRGRGGGKRPIRGRSPQSSNSYFVRRDPVGPHPNDASPANESGYSRVGRGNSEVTPVDGITRQFGRMRPDHQYGSRYESPSVGNSRIVQSVPVGKDRTPTPFDISSTAGQRYANNFSSQSSFGFTPPDLVQKEKKPSQSIVSDSQDSQFHGEIQMGKGASEGTLENDEIENSEIQQKGFSFDICEERSGNVVRLKTPLHAKNKAMRNETKRLMRGVDNIQVLRPGMILLKGYLQLTDQIKLIKSCRNLGRGPGGFYQPGYRDGAKLHLKMMCLGKNWDPQTSMYGDERPVDGGKPPPIPQEFQQLVKGAIKECHNYLESQPGVKNAREILPSVSPNICIINFYTKTGKLGLHQDKDESPESLRKGLPVVSFSLGDSAEFLYGDQRDIDNADKLLLESGDVLIFGGKSRNIFHGVPSISPDTAPKALLEETDLKPGRLNLTFREY